MKLEIHSKKHGIKTIFIDDEDYEKINKYTWHVNINHSGILYAEASVYNKTGIKIIRMHRLIMNAQKGQIIDHKNRNGLDNRKENLRICKHAENMRNSKISKNNSTGFKGVTIFTCKNKDKIYKYIIAQIRVNNKKKYIGSFATVKKAHEAYCLAADKYHKEFANYGIDNI